MLDVHFFAAAREAAGQETTTIDNPPATLDELLDVLKTTHAGTTAAGMGFAEVLERCSFLIDGQRAEAEASLNGAERVDVLPPFAGG